MFAEGRIPLYGGSTGKPSLPTSLGPYLLPPRLSSLKFEFTLVRDLLVTGLSVYLYNFTSL